MRNLNSLIEADFVLTVWWVRLNSWVPFEFPYDRPVNNLKGKSCHRLLRLMNFSCNSVVELLKLSKWKTEHLGLENQRVDLLMLRWIFQALENPCSKALLSEDGNIDGWRDGRVDRGRLIIPIKSPPYLSLSVSSRAPIEPITSRGGKSVFTLRSAIEMLHRYIWTARLWTRDDIHASL